VDAVQVSLFFSGWVLVVNNIFVSQYWRLRFVVSSDCSYSWTLRLKRYSATRGRVVAVNWTWTLRRRLPPTAQPYWVLTSQAWVCW